MREGREVSATEARQVLADAVSLASRPTSWLVDAADLLAEPDPGPTAMLVEDLIVDRALVAAVGRWKRPRATGF